MYPSDGIAVPSQLIGPSYLEWESSYPKTINENATCVSWGGYDVSVPSLKIKNTKCDTTDDHSENDLKTYYDKNLAGSYDDNYLIRGYLCETKAIHTIAAYERIVRVNLL